MNSDVLRDKLLRILEQIVSSKVYEWTDQT